jgi:hypothetical protein
MMPPLIRRSLLVSALVLHAALSLCGPGHHAFDGWGSAPCESKADAAALHPAEGACPACAYLALPAFVAEPAVASPSEPPARAESIARADTPRPAARRGPASPRAPPVAPAA